MNDQPIRQAHVDRDEGAIYFLTDASSAKDEDVERNPNYWDKPKPYLDRVVVRFVTDSAARAAALESGSLDLGAGGQAETPQGGKGGQLLEDITTLHSGFSWFNQRNH